MPKLSFVFGLLLITLGATTYLAIDATSITGPVASGLGIGLLVCGILGMTAPRLYFVSTAVAVGLGIGGMCRGLSVSLLHLLAEHRVSERIPSATYAQFTMGMLSVVFLAFALKLLVDRQRARYPNL